MSAAAGFPLDAGLVFQGKPMRVTGRMLLEGATGQRSLRSLAFTGRLEAGGLPLASFCWSFFAFFAGTD